MIFLGQFLPHECMCASWRVNFPSITPNLPGNAIDVFKAVAVGTRIKLFFTQMLWASYQKLPRKTVGWQKIRNGSKALPQGLIESVDLRGRQRVHSKSQRTHDTCCDIAQIPAEESDIAGHSTLAKSKQARFPCKYSLARLCFRSFVHRHRLQLNGFVLFRSLDTSLGGRHNTTTELSRDSRPCRFAVEEQNKPTKLTRSRRVRARKPRRECRNGATTGEKKFL